MHGRVKKDVQPSAEEAAAKRAQIAKYIQAKDLFLHRRAQHLVDDKTKELTAKLIELNPDFYSLWSLRKEIALAAFQAQSAAASSTRASADTQGLPLLPQTRCVERAVLCAVCVPGSGCVVVRRGRRRCVRRSWWWRRRGSGGTRNGAAHTRAGAAPPSLPLRCAEADVHVLWWCGDVAVFSYSAWHHRLWVLDQGESDLQQELRLCSLMLNMDHRNCQPHLPHSSAAAAAISLQCSSPPPFPPSRCVQSTAGTIAGPSLREREPRPRTSSPSPRSQHSAAHSTAAAG